MVKPKGFEMKAARFLALSLPLLLCHGGGGFFPQDAAELWQPVLLLHACLLELPPKQPKFLPKLTYVHLPSIWLPSTPG